MSLIRKTLRAIKLLQSVLAKETFENELKLLPKESGNLRRSRMQIASHIYQKTNGWVYFGPLSKLRIPEKSLLAQFPKYLLGCYEQELHPILNSWIANPPSRLIDIGTSVGYYIVGLAKSMPSTKFIGFETEDQYRLEAQYLAEFNGVHERITLRGHCDTKLLNAEIDKNSYIICDCEGSELELLDPSLVPLLRTARILCELHDFFAPEVESIIVSRFINTHSIEFIDEKPRQPNDYRILQGLPLYEAGYAVSESRYIQDGRVTSLRFVYLVPLSQNS